MSFLDTIKEDFKKQPWYVWAGAITGGGVVIFFIVKERLAASSATTPAASSATTPTATDPLNGYDMSQMAGLPYGYEDTSASNSDGVSSGTTTTGSTDTSGSTSGSTTGSTDTSGSTSTTTTGSTSGSTSGTHAPGSTFVANGIIHYVATGSRNLASIARKFNLQSYNSIYAIPENQKTIGKLNAKDAEHYKPPAGQVIVLPPGTNTGSGGPVSHWAGNPFSDIGLSPEAVGWS